MDMVGQPSEVPFWGAVHSNRRN